jgi:hypothetical protein
VGFNITTKQANPDEQQRWSRTHLNTGDAQLGKTSILAWRVYGRLTSRWEPLP